jgi:hypothetical protein
MLVHGRACSHRGNACTCMQGGSISQFTRCNAQCGRCHSVGLFGIEPRCVHYLDHSGMYARADEQTTPKIRIGLLSGLHTHKHTRTYNSKKKKKTTLASLRHCLDHIALFDGRSPIHRARCGERVCSLSELCGRHSLLCVWWSVVHTPETSTNRDLQQAHAYRQQDWMVSHLLYRDPAVSRCFHLAGQLLVHCTSR